MTIKQAVKQEFKTDEVKLTAIIEDNCARRLNVPATPCFRKRVRGAQQALKREGYIKHVSYGKWRKAG